MSAFLVKYNLNNKKPRSLEKTRVIATSNPFITHKLLEIELDVLHLNSFPFHAFNLVETAMFMDLSRGKSVAEKRKPLL